MLRIAARTYGLTPRKGSEGRTLMKNTATVVVGPLDTTVYLLQDDNHLLCIMTSHFLTHYHRFSNVLRDRVAEALGVTRDQVFVFSSHNHCAVKLNHEQYAIGLEESDVILDDDELTWEGQQLLYRTVETATELKDHLEPVSIWYGVGHERRITHNRKGRRADGSTYFMREEDRLRLGADYSGDIDDDAPVVGFKNDDGDFVAFLTQFTGHPVSAFHCDYPIVFGEYPQVACDDLSSAYGGVPSGFLQGCAGDTNSKGLLSHKSVDENIADAKHYGHCLGETYVRTAERLGQSTRSDLDFCWEWAAIPYKRVPPKAELRRMIENTEAFISTCETGDDSAARECCGLNFPSNMTLPYKAALVEPIKRWAEWALSFRTGNRLHEAPTERRFRVGAIRIGDVGIVGMPCEPFLGIGRQIKEKSPLPLTIPCGYMNDTSPAYVPDAPNNGDTEYMSAFYRYTTTMLPYRYPAGNLLAKAGVRMLHSLAGAAG